VAVTLDELSNRLIGPRCEMAKVEAEESEHVDDIGPARECGVTLGAGPVALQSLVAYPPIGNACSLR
jgi:hypothetical protein